MNSQEKLNSEKKVFTRVPCCKTERNTTKNLYNVAYCDEIQSFYL